jgi:hypothetical protein
LHISWSAKLPTLDMQWKCTRRIKTVRKTILAEAFFIHRHNLQLVQNIAWGGGRGGGQCQLSSQQKGSGPTQEGLQYFLHADTASAFNSAIRRLQITSFKNVRGKPSSGGEAKRAALHSRPEGSGSNTATEVKKLNYLAWQVFRICTVSCDRNFKHTPDFASVLIVAPRVLSEIKNKSKLVTYKFPLTAEDMSEDPSRHSPTRNECSSGSATT